MDEKLKIALVSKNEKLKFDLFKKMKGRGVRPVGCYLFCYIMVVFILR
jgi:hypothetical protein